MRKRRDKSPSCVPPWILACILFAWGSCRCQDTAEPRDAATPASAPRRELLGPTFAPPDEGTPKTGGTLTLGMDAEPPSLTFMLDADTWILRLTSHNVYEALLRSAGDHDEPELAVSHAIEKGGLVHSFVLRKGVEWHDGAAFSVDDVLFTFDRLMDPKVRSGSLRGDFAGLRTWERVGTDGVRLTFDRALFTHTQAITTLPILPKHVFRARDFNTDPAHRAPVGTGPFRFDHWTEGQEIVLTRNARYWDPARAGHLDRIVFRIQRDRTVLFQLLRRGEVDFLHRLLPDQQEEVHHNPAFARGKGYRYLDWLSPDYVFFQYNTKRPYFSDKRLRQAMTLLMNRQKHIPQVTRQSARLISGPFWPGSPAYDPSVEPWPFDPKRAERMLDDLGWHLGGDGVRVKAGERFAFRFLLPSGSKVTEQLATLVQHDLKRAGILMDLVPLDWALFQDRLRKHDFDLTAYVVATDLEQDTYPVLHSSQAEGGLNYGSFSNAEIDTLIEKIRGTLEVNARRPLEHALHRLVHEEVPMTFLFTTGYTALFSDRFSGVYPSIPFFPLRDIWLNRP